jgi:hypothetical protein
MPEPRRSNALVLFRRHARRLAVARGRRLAPVVVAGTSSRSSLRGAFSPAAAFGADFAVTIQKTTRTDAFLERT